ncbi:hypothetical protein R3P38DRAFT_2758983 [Favolaschia claudopus]|uniref:Uncharacterized protein n=1 Tax=Favolaschia claudopus TaxID=2862362 RepID=A0AAW0E2R4_9AGAR
MQRATSVDNYEGVDVRRFEFGTQPATAGRDNCGNLLPDIAGGKGGRSVWRIKRVNSSKKPTTPNSLLGTATSSHPQEGLIEFEAGNPVPDSISTDLAISRPQICRKFIQLLHLVRSYAHPRRKNPLPTLSLLLVKLLTAYQFNRQRRRRSARLLAMSVRGDELYRRLNAKGCARVVDATKQRVRATATS